MALESVPDPLNVNKIQTNEIITRDLESRTISADAVSGRGKGAVITASKIILGNFTIYAKDDGLYATTPDGTDTKIELIDLSFVPIPPDVDLLPVSPRENVELDKPIGGGPDKEGAGLGRGNATGGGGAVNSTSSTPGVPYEAPSEGKITPGGDGEGYKAITDAAKAKLPPSMNNPEFLGCLDNLAKSKNVPADSLLTVMQIESGFTSTDVPGKGASAVNKYSGASGLNQIIPSTAKGLGYTVEQIQGMSASEQMCGPVTKYFNMQTLPEKPSTADLYLANFYPAAVGKPDDYVMGDVSGGGSREQIAAANPIFKGSDGLVSVGSVKNWIKTKYPSAQ